MAHKPKKSLGQNFLRDDTVIADILHHAQLTKDDVVVEIGPGTGVLTEKLAAVAKRVIAVEIDRTLAAELEEKFSPHENVSIVADDILHANIPELLKEYAAGEESYRVIANIPYYITAPIVRLFLETPTPPTEMMLMVQKEVAERIVAEPGKMSLLTVSVQYYADPAYLFTVPCKAFFPAPNVDSAVVRIVFRADAEENKDTKQFFSVVKAGFAAKRKTLTNNLTNGLHKSKKDVENVLAMCNIAPTARAQELSIAQWKKLAQLFSNAG